MTAGGPLGGAPACAAGVRALRRGTWLALALLLLGLPPAGPPAAQAQTEVAEQLGEAFPAEVARRIGEIVRAAEDEGVPPSLLVDKALEGAAKGAPPERVLETVTTLARELREARVVVGPEAGPEALSAAADALRKGADRAELRALAERHPQHLPMALLVVGDLVAEGLDPGGAREVVEEAVRSGYAGDRLLTLPAALRGRIRAGAAPGAAATDLQRALRQGRPLRPPR